MKRWISLGILLLWPTLLLAQTVGNYTLSLTPLPSDLSKQYLSNMFGTVDGVLYGTGNIISHLFGVYNGAVLVLGGIVVMYTFLIGTVKTAHDGEVLGKEWSSIWIPLRATAGIALLIPKATGYSFIQIFMMWVVVQGIGAADSVWNAALGYLYSGGIIIKQNYAGSNPVSTYPMVSKSAQLLRSLSCVEMLQQEINTYIAYQKQNGITPLSTPPNFYNDIVSAINNSDPRPGSNSVQFPQSNYYGTNGVCGGISWPSVWKDLPTNNTAVTTSNSVLTSSPSYAGGTLSTLISLNNPAPPPTAQPQSVNMWLASWYSDTSRSRAIAQAISNLQPYARSIVSNYLSDKPVSLGMLNGGLWSGPNSGSYLIPGSLLGDAASSYYGIMSTAMSAMAQGVDNPQVLAAWIKGPNGAEAQGWAMAGAYYFNIINANQRVGNVTSGSLPDVATLSSDFTVDTRVTNVLGGKTSQYVTNLQTLINGQNASAQNSSPNDSNDLIVSPNGPFITGAVEYGSSLTYGSSNVQAGGSPALLRFSGAVSGGNGNTQALTSSMDGVLEGIGNWLANMTNSQINNTNPVIGIATFGGNLVDMAYNGIIAMAISGFFLTFALGLIPFDSIGNAGISIVTAVTGFYTPLYITYLTFGLTMAYYIPLIPFIIFIFGVIGWFIAVAEAMLAAPLVALGISHPEGHAILGKADPAVALLVNVFLRPTFMVLGLLFGMLVSYVGLWLVNQGFSQAYAMSLTATSGVGGAFSQIAGMVVYVLIAMQIVQKSFSLIHIIPDQVMRWLGMNIEGMGGEAEAESAIGGGVRSGFGKVSGFTGASVEAGQALGKASGTMAKSMGKAASKKGGGGGA